MATPHKRPNCGPNCENTFACAAVWPDGEKRHIPKGFLGRGNVCAPKRCVSTVPINSKARDGDFDACIPQSNPPTLSLKRGGAREG